MFSNISFLWWLDDLTELNVEFSIPPLKPTFPTKIGGCVKFWKFTTTFAFLFFI